MAVRFDAVGDRLISTAGLPTGNYTYTCWVKLAVNRGNNVFASFVAMESTNGNDYAVLSVYTSGNGLWMYVNADGNPPRLTLTVGTWYKVAVTVSGTATAFYAAAEGGSLALIGSGTVSAGARARLTIGSDVYDEWVNGSVAAFKMWDAVLNATELAAEFTQSAPARTTALNRYYPFTELPGTADASGNGRNLTAGATAVTIEAGPNILPGNSTQITVRSARAAARNTRPQLTQGNALLLATARTATRAARPTPTQRSALTVRAARGTSRATRPATGQHAPLQVRAVRAATRTVTVPVTQRGTILLLAARTGTTATRLALTHTTVIDVRPAVAATRATRPLAGTTTALIVRNAATTLRADTPLLHAPAPLTVLDARAATHTVRVGLTHRSLINARNARAATRAERATHTVPAGDPVKNPTRVVVVATGAHADTHPAGGRVTHGPTAGQARTSNTRSAVLVTF